MADSLQAGTNKNMQDLSQGPRQTAESEKTQTVELCSKMHAVWSCSADNVQNKTEPTPEISRLVLMCSHSNRIINSALLSDLQQKISSETNLEEISDVASGPDEGQPKSALHIPRFNYQATYVTMWTYIKTHYSCKSAMALTSEI